MIRVEIKDDEIKNLMQQILKNLGDLRPFFVSIVPIVHRSIVANFREGGRPTRWKPLAPSTIAARQREGTWPGFRGSQPILMRYGFLFQSIGTVRNISKKRFEYGTNLLKAGLLQYGGTINLPAMEIMPKRAKALRFVINGNVVFAKRAKIPARSVTIPGRPFVLFQKSDIALITSYAAAFAFDVDTGKRLLSKLTRGLANA